MKAIFEKINEMQAAGIIGKYAIGVLSALPSISNPLRLLTLPSSRPCPCDPARYSSALAPIYDYLQARGRKLEGEYIVVDGWPVQFLPPADALDEEALIEAIETSVEGVRTWVYRQNT